ncbi:MAG: nucleotide exchange factor GrpE, partial [Patescibacteria group bacterium]
MIKRKKISYCSEEDGDSGTQIKKIRQRLKDCQKEKEEYLTQAQRARADLINYQRRQEQALEELSKFGQAGLIKELLAVLESLEAGAKKNRDLEQIKSQLENIFKKYGLAEIKSVGEKFNPEFHEAVEQIESKEESGTIVE